MAPAFRVERRFRGDPEKQTSLRARRMACTADFYSRQMHTARENSTRIANHEITSEREVVAEFEFIGLEPLVHRAE